MKIEPLPTNLFQQAKLLGITDIILSFSGGSDEGYLDVHTSGYDVDGSNSFFSVLENWAWEVYSYNGAGDGTDYGDDITYDLVNKKVYASEWKTARVDGDTDTNDLVLTENI